MNIRNFFPRQLVGSVAGAVLCTLISADVVAAPFAAELRDFVAGSSAGVAGISIVDVASGETVFEHNGAMPLKPASVLKIAASAAALELLGPEYTFRTEFWADNTAGGGANALTVVGGGAPDFTTEQAWLVARELHRRGLRRVDKVILDESRFVSLRPSTGQRAYRAGSAGIAFNYNSLGFEFCPTAPGKPATASVDPVESGAVLSGVVRTGRGPGVSVDAKDRALHYRIGGFVPLGPCVTLYRSVPDTQAYFGKTFVELLRSSGIQVLRGAAAGTRPADARLVYEHHSRSLLDIVRDLNHYSNNFIAEQLLLALGEAQGGARDRALGLSRIVEYVQRLGIPTENINLDDASGLSHSNRFTARGIAVILHHLAHDLAVGPEFEISLSVSSRNGTLRERDFGDEDRVVRGKTGTLDGVSSLAGYLTARSGRRLAFAILVNNTPSKDRAVRFEDRIVELMYLGA